MVYSLEIRQRTTKHLEQCKDINLVMSAYGVSRSTLFSWRKLKQETGIVAPDTLDRKPQKIDKDTLRVYVTQNSDAYLFAIVDQ